MCVMSASFVPSQQASFKLPGQVSQRRLPAIRKILLVVFLLIHLAAKLEEQGGCHNLVKCRPSESRFVQHVDLPAVASRRFWVICLQRLSRLESACAQAPKNRRGNNRQGRMFWHLVDAYEPRSVATAVTAITAALSAFPTTAIRTNCAKWGEDGQPRSGASQRPHFLDSIDTGDLLRVQVCLSAL